MIQPREFAARAQERRERDHVELDPAHAADHRLLADARELVRADQPAEKQIADLAMAAERGVIGEDHVVADDAVVRDVRATMNMPRSPTRVSPPPPTVPVFIVTCSRIEHFSPIVSRVGSPL
jgi:hypothetical protein